MTLPDLRSIKIDIGDGVVLRPFVQNDPPAIFETVKRNEQHLIEFMRWLTPDYSLETASDFVERSIDNAEKKESLSFGIFRSGSFLGSIGFVYLDTNVRKTEIGYWIDKGEEGKGIISAATEKLIDLAFNEFGMNKVEIRCSVKNIRSAAVPKRFGFVQEGRLRHSDILNGQFHDFYVFGLLKDEWENDNITL